MHRRIISAAACALCAGILVNTSLFAAAAPADKAPDYSDISARATSDPAALRQLQQAAEAGHVKAQFFLAVQYAGGRGVPQDFGKSAYWYRKAAEQGYAKAENCLANQYALGQGVPQSFVNAANWYRKAAEQGDVSAQNSLALMYYSGKGVRRSTSRAIRWWKRAAAQGNELAKHMIDMVEHRERR